jgi:para-nitrobenzyl esterase
MRERERSSRIHEAGELRPRLLHVLKSVPASAVLLCALGAGCGLSSEPPPARQADPATRRTTALGPVVGYAGTAGTHAWRGIPFAQPPVGALRWRAPVAAAAWTGERAALADAAPCAQPPPPIGGEPNRDGSAGGEDCLYLNVFAPAFAPDAVPQGEARLPVMVWIHGGGNSIGDARIYDGGHLAAKHGVVVVAVQYRLGPFGWLRHAALRADAGATDADRSGNFGTLDLVEALRWVKANVAAFGGDPARVTVFGESAGGRNVFALLQSPLAAGLFHRAIAQSGGLSAPTLAEAESLATDAEPGHENSSNELLLRLLSAHRGAADREAARALSASLTPTEVAAFLRERTPGEIFAAYTGSQGMGMLRFPQLFPDGAVMPADAADAHFPAGRYNRVPVIAGTNRDENKLFMAFDREYVRLWFRVLPSVRDEERYQRDAEYQALAWKLNGADDPARWMRSVQGPSVFAYRFDWDELDRFLWVDWSFVIGAGHAVEIPFVFGDFDIPLLRSLFAEDDLATRRRLSDAMMSYWAEFAANGAPGRGRGGELPLWKPWEESAPDAERFLVLDSEAGGGIRMSADAITSTELVSRVLADARFADAGERCAFLGRLRGWRPLPAADIARAGCTEAQLATRR